MSLEAKLDSVVTQLKNIASGGFTYKTVTDPTGKQTIKAKVDKQEAEKIKVTAKIQADASAQIYKKVLGLGFNEENTKKTAKIFKDIFGMGSFGGALSRKSTRSDINFLLRQMEWFDFKSDLLHYAFNTEEYQEEMLSHMRRLVGLQTGSKEKKKTETGGLMDKFKNIAGLAVLGTGFFLIISALANAGKVDIEKTFKILLLIGGIIGVFYLISKISFNIIGATLVLGGIVYLIGYLAEKLQKYAKNNWNEIDQGMKRGGVAILSFIAFLGIVFTITKFGGKINTLISGGILAGMVYLVGYLAKNLQKFSGKDWNSIDSGLKRGGIAMLSFIALFGIVSTITKFGGVINTLVSGGIMFELVYLIGYLAENLEKFANKDWDSIDAGLKRAGIAFGSLVAAFGIIAGITFFTGEITSLIAGGVMLALAKVMDMSADSLIKFGNVNGDNLIDVAKGMVAIGGGLVAMLGGTLMGTAGALADKLTSFIGLDPVSFIKKFETLNADKLLSLGNGIKFLAEGLKYLSQGIELKNIINDLNLLIQPLLIFSNVLDTFSKSYKILVNDLMLLTAPLLSFSSALDTFSSSYKQLEKIKMESEINQNYNMNLKSDTGIQKAILDLHQQELSVQQAQLEQLKINGNLLYQLVANGGIGKGVSLPQPNISIKSPSFNTKENFMNNMKLMSMSLQG